MRYEREDHARFLEAELRYQTEGFRQTMETSAIALLQDKEELFVAKFLKLQDGQLILKFSNERGLPRLQDHLYCFTLPKEMRNYSQWDKRTYGALVKAKLDFSEVVCIWHAPGDKGFSLAGLRGVSSEFANHIQGSPGIILFLGPKKPPYEYLANLQTLVRNRTNPMVSEVLDRDLTDKAWSPVLVDTKRDIADFLQKQLGVNNTLIVQGPPGTGKTYMIADLCARYCAEGASVLVTALTNRALMEVAKKPALRELLKAKGVHKRNLTMDEFHDLPGIQDLQQVGPLPGALVLSSFFLASGHAVEIGEVPPFDVVVVDEASQALLSMLAAAKVLGKHNVWVGDVRQLPPVVQTSADKVRKSVSGALVDGLRAMTACGTYPVYQLTRTHRLPPRAARYTGLFYQDTLRSMNELKSDLDYPGLPEQWASYFHPEGGPTLIQIPMELASSRPQLAIHFVSELVRHLCEQDDGRSIAVLSHSVATTIALQRKVLGTVGRRKDLLVETVARVQGITRDITIYLVPNQGYYHSLERRLFNVATSRASRHTFIILDPTALGSNTLDPVVKQYLRTLSDEFCFLLPAGPLLGSQ